MAENNNLNTLINLNGLITFKNRIQSKIDTVTESISTETTRAKDVEQSLSARIGEVTTTVGNLKTIDLKVLGENEYNTETGVPTVSNPASNFIYLVPDSTTEGAGSYVEWLYVGGAFERIGTTAVDLANYALKSTVETLNTKVDNNKAALEESKAEKGHTHSNYVSTVTSSGSGNAVTSVSIDGNTLTYTKGSTFSTSGHTHTTSIATSTATSELTLSADNKYKLTAGGDTFIFTTPKDTHYKAIPVLGATGATANATTATTNTTTYLGIVENSSQSDQVQIKGSGATTVSATNGVLTISSTNTTYTNGTGLLLNDTTFSLSSSGVTAGSYGPSSNVTGTNNTTLTVPYITVDTYGRVTSISNKTYTSKNTEYSAATTSANGLMSKEDKTKLNGLEISTTTNLGIANTKTTQQIGYVSGLTKAAWNSNQTDGALYRQAYSSTWAHMIFGDYRTGHLAVRGLSGGTFTTWYNVLDSGNFSTWAAKASHEHTWSNISDRAKCDIDTSGTISGGSYKFNNSSTASITYNSTTGAIEFNVG